MRRKWLAGIGLLLVAVILVVAGCSVGTGVPQQPTGSSIILSQQNTGIWVTGEGKITVVPDVAILSLGVEVQAKTVAEAQKQAQVAMTAVINALKGRGVADKDIKTQQFSIYPVIHFEKNQQILDGYRVTNIVTAKVRKIADTGSIIDAVAEAGGDYTRINSVAFAVDDPTAYYKEVRDKAMADAGAKAKQLADLGGVGLGKPTYINESGLVYPFPRDYYLKEGGAPAPAPTTPITPGETEIRLTVQVVYGIK